MESMIEPSSASEEEVDDMKKKIKEALNSLVYCRTRCSEMLESAHRRRSMSDLDLHCLAFLEKEISHIVACLMALSPQHYAHERMMLWLRDLTFAASETLPRALDEADPQRHTLLGRGLRCICHGHRRRDWLSSEVERFYQLAESPVKYKHRLLSAWPFAGGFLVPRDTDWSGQLPPANWIVSFETINLLALYLVMFPYRYIFEKDQLVMKCLFEGIFNVEGFYTLLAEDKVRQDRCFSRLVNQNIITQAAASFKCYNPDEAQAWKWDVSGQHYQYLSSKSADMGFVFTSATLNVAATSGNDASRLPRRLALHYDDPSIPSLLPKIDLSQIRSLAVSGEVSGVPVDKFVNLVLLDVESWKNFEDEDLLRVCRSKMFFLKYLSIRSTRVSNLPPEIKELCSLKILDASYTQVTELPLEVFVATRLHRLDLRGTLIRQLTLPKQILGLQESLNALLLGSDGTINSAEATVTRLPHDIRRFRNLETLATIDLSEQPASFISALGDLKRLRVLAITWSFHQSSDRDYCEALLSSIKRWIRLESLTIHSGLGCSMGFLGSLSDTCLKLETFKVTVGSFAGVPRWFQRLMYLSFVQITVCKLGAHDLEILGGLPKLKRLILGLDFIAREAIVIENEGFHELDRLSIDCPLPWLTFESGALPKLTYLQIDFRACPTSQISVPSGISNLTSLKEVGLWYNVRYANSCSVKMTVEAVSKEVAKRGNTSQVIGLFINGIEQDDVQAGAEAEIAIQAVREISEA